MQKRQTVVISEDVLEYLAELSFLLFQKGYFKFIEYAFQYVDYIYDKIFEKIYIAKHNKVPAKHRDFGDFYFIIKSNKRTAWHIYFLNIRFSS